MLCITHLPQIASYADRHLTVRKEVIQNATETKVRTMEGPERLQELAEMIGGQRITDTGAGAGQELLDAARVRGDRRSQGDKRHVSCRRADESGRPDARMVPAARRAFAAVPF